MTPPQLPQAKWPSWRACAVLFVVFALPLVHLASLWLTQAAVFPPVSTVLVRDVFPRARVSVWAPRRCSGRFVGPPAAAKGAAFPAAVVREAVVDRRAVSRRQFRRDVDSRRPFERLVVYVSAHLSVRLSKANASVALEGAEGIVARVDHVTHANPFVEAYGVYRPGRKTKQGHEISEWQVVLSLVPNDTHAGVFPDYASFSAALQVLPGAVLRFSLPLKSFDGQVLPFEPVFDLACAVGWHHPDVYPGLTRIQPGAPTCGKRGAHVKGAVVFGGSALYGKKREDPSHYREIAHFAARALTGPVRFDTVVMPIVANNSVADATTHCGTDQACLEEHHDANVALLQRVAVVVEEELDVLGMSRQLFKNVILIPFCRLGSDTNATEKGDPCASSHRYGQYHASFFAYAMLSPYYKWSVSYDMDEFLLMKPGMRRSSSTDALLDKASGRRKGHMFFSWLNFRVTSSASRSVTRALMGGRAPVLRNRTDSKKQSSCYDFTKDPTGKAAVRCDTGLGFSIHRPIILAPDGKGLDQVQGNVRSRLLRTWHARLGSSTGKCDYVETDQ